MVFFLPLPQYLSMAANSLDTHRNKLLMVSISIEKVAKAVFSIALLKKAGLDNIPVILWQKFWPTIKNMMVQLFTTSVSLGVIPEQWKTTRIIPFKKLQKTDYTKLEAYCLISLLVTLRKMLESIIAPRLTFLADKYSLLSYNYFRGLKQKTTIDTLLILQEKIY